MGLIIWSITTYLKANIGKKLFPILASREKKSCEWGRVNFSTTSWDLSKMSVVIDEFLRDIFSCFGARKSILRQSWVTNFHIFLLGAHQWAGKGGWHLMQILLNLVSSPDFYLLNVGMSDTETQQNSSPTFWGKTYYI